MSALIELLPFMVTTIQKKNKGYQLSTYVSDKKNERETSLPLKCKGTYGHSMEFSQEEMRGNITIIIKRNNRDVSVSNNNSHSILLIIKRFFQI